MTTGIGSHQSAKMKNDEWLSPQAIVYKLGPFDLDPCVPIKRPWDTAKNHYSKLDNGLSQKWFGRIWLNPPYGLESKKWLKKMAHHNNGIALLFARTETQMFWDYIWTKATALYFIKGRLYFHYVDGTRSKANSGAPSVLVAYGKENAEILYNCGIEGAFVPLEKHIKKITM